MLPRAVLLALTLALTGPLLAATGPATAASPAAQAPTPSASPAPTAAAESVKWYRVRPSYDGENEYLYEIAERFLGDGDRLDEIFELNRGRLQADGNRLTVPDEIESGWVLRMPADAEGPGLETGPLPAVAPSAPAASAPALRATTTPQKSGVSPILLIAGLLLVVAGAVLAVLLARRRRTAPPAAGVVVPRQRTGEETPAFDAAASWTIDRALRVLATSAVAAGRPVPPVLRVSVGESWIGLRLAEADAAPCEPWEAREDGTLWVAALRALQALPADQQLAALCPRLVTLGVQDGTRELLDLGRVAGPVSLRGDAPATRALLGAWATELTGSPWSSGVRVVAGGLLPEVRDAGPVLSVPALDDAVTQATGETAPDDGWLSVLLLGAVPAGRDADRVRELVAREGRPWAVVVLGRARTEAVQLTLHPDGRLDTGSLGVTVRTARAAAEPKPV
ncbi:hypothetical protein ACQP2Y_26370 [Actinoplanes sp. CA-051413]|uniref:LysM peptidoglycan-binding domain-containing protein n=1 Tax=Actinoplanes sp. CA-051413 TaxID=3239899 RepID=UPI003D9528BB